MKSEETYFDPRKEVYKSDSDLEGAIRPQEFEEFSGQDKILKNLKVFFYCLFK